MLQRFCVEDYGVICLPMGIYTPSATRHHEAAARTSVAEQNLQLILANRGKQRGTWLPHSAQKVYLYALHEVQVSLRAVCDLEDFNRATAARHDSVGAHGVVSAFLTAADVKPVLQHCAHVTMSS